VTPGKRKGSRFELDVRDYLRERGYAAERCYGAGRSDDIGDVRGLPGFVIEAKNQREMRLAEWLTETEVERVNAGEPFGVLVAKRKMKTVADAYAVMPLRQLVDLVDELTRGRCEAAAMHTPLQPGEVLARS